MKNGKRIISLCCAIMVILSMLALSAFAESNHSDTAYKFTFNSGKSYTITPRSKKDTSSVYVNIQSANNHTSLCVAALACSADGSYTINKTCVKGDIVDFVRCSIGTGYPYKYNIHTWIYEHGYRYACLEFWAEDSLRDTVSGVWSPDSVGTYNYATQ